MTAGVYLHYVACYSAGSCVGVGETNDNALSSHPVAKLVRLVLVHGSVDVGLAVPAGVQALGPGEPCASGCQRGPMSERRRDDGRCPNVPVWLQVSQEIFLADLAVVDRAP